MGDLDSLEKFYKEISDKKIYQQFFEMFRLLESAVVELAELNGHSSKEPISPTLFCLEHGISFDERGKIIVMLNKLISENRDIDSSALKLELIKKVPKLDSFSDEVILGMITTFRKTYVIEED